MLVKKIVKLVSISALVLASTQLLAADQSMSDADIAKAVQQKLNSEGNVKSVMGPMIVVDVKDGKAYLSGMVDTSDQKENAEKLVKAVTGVKSVKNEIYSK